MFTQLMHYVLLFFWYLVIHIPPFLAVIDTKKSGDYEKR